MFGKQITRKAFALAAAAGLAGAGCATSQRPTSADVTLELAAKDIRIAELERQKHQHEARIAQLIRRGGAGVGERRPDVASRPRAGEAQLSPIARPGECFARVFVRAEYAEQTERVVKREASERLEIEPATFEWVQEQVVVKDASSKLVQIDAEYGTNTEIIELEPARSLWRTGRSARWGLADAGLVATAGKLGVPIGSAQPGQCFAEYATQARFETIEEQVLESEASSRVEVVAAKYKHVEEQIVVSEAVEKLEKVPAVYETVTEKILIKPAHSMWKKGRGPVERVDDSTGEIMCLVQVPDEYRSVTKRVLKTAATTKRIAIPARYRTVKVRRLVTPASERRVEIPARYTTVRKRQKIAEGTTSWVAEGRPGDGEATGRLLCEAGTPARTRTITQRVVKSPASTRTVEIPAEYETVKVKKVVSPARERRISIPAEYQEVTTQRLVRDGRLEWRSILCETNTTPDLITDLQRALKTKGHDPGPIDGVVGSQTLSAVRSFQKKQGLPSGDITLTTLDALGVRH